MTLSLEEISAEIGVKLLISRYSETVDSRDLAGAVALFSENATLTVNDEKHQGHAGLSAWLEILAGSPAGIHMTSNTIVTLDPSQAGRAQARSDVAFIRKSPDGWKILAAGHYRDVCEIRESAWVFVAREIEIS